MKELFDDCQHPFYYDLETKEIVNGDESDDESDDDEPVVELVVHADEALAHPPYYCNGGCGKKMGEGNDDECKRICDECKRICDGCNCMVEDTQYLPSKADDPGNYGLDYCLPCYEKVEKFEFVENIP